MLVIQGLQYQNQAARKEEKNMFRSKKQQRDSPQLACAGGGVEDVVKCLEKTAVLHGPGGANSSPLPSNEEVTSLT